MTLVSIILPTYNRVNRLGRAIESVLRQSYEHWELIIWDDGSTDTTSNLVRAYKDERIYYHQDANHGAYHARNRAVEASRGDFIAFLDSDDEWTPEKLADQMTALESFPQIDILFSDFINNDEISGRSIQTFTEYSSAMRLLQTRLLMKDLILVTGGMLEGLGNSNFIATDSIILHRDVFLKTGGFLEEFHNAADFLLWWRLGLAGAQFAYIDKVHLKRYKGADSLSGARISSSKSLIKILTICKEETMVAQRGDLLPRLDGLLKNAWMNLVPLHWQKGDRRAAWQDFCRSMEYGFSLGAIRLLLFSMAGLVSRRGR